MAWQDDKQLVDRDLQHEEEKQRQRGLAEEENDEFRELAREDERDAETEHAGKVLAAMQAILDKQKVVVSSLQLPQREAIALEYLQAAVSGRQANQGTFVLASDRRDMLEQALAVLQPNLTNMSPDKLRELGDYGQLVEKLGDLRGNLSDLEDAQDELLDNALELPDLTKESPDTDDAPKPPSALSNGPPIAEPKKKSELSEGAAVPAKQYESTLSQGAAVLEKKPAKSTLDE